MDTLDERTAAQRRQNPTQPPPPCSVCGNHVASVDEDPDTGLLRRRPCGCAD